jgi:hypothetical protein
MLFKKLIRCITSPPAPLQVERGVGFPSLRSGEGLGEGIFTSSLIVKLHYRVRLPQVRFTTLFYPATGVPRLLDDCPSILQN